MSGESAADQAELTRRIVEVLRRAPGSTAREILAGLPDAVRRGIARRDVNSVLYRGAGSTFVRSDEEKPRWRLAAVPASSSRPATREQAKTSSRQSRPESPRSTPPAAAEDAPEVQDIARILFDD
jgi:hypothetical protein